MRWVAPLLATALLTTPTIAQERRTIPRAFHGDWALSIEQCAPGPEDAGNMRITARQMQTFESRLDIQNVSILAPDRIEYRARVHHGDATYGDRARLTLTDGGRGLQVGDSFPYVFFVRCRR